MNQQAIAEALEIHRDGVVSSIESVEGHVGSSANAMMATAARLVSC